jgi:lysyl-tRNA synthetase class 2
MPLEDQIEQRRANFEALAALGVNRFPHSFDATETVSSIAEQHSGATGEALEASRPEVRVAGRILGIRAFGKASFLVLSDGRQTVQVYLRQDSLTEVCTGCSISAITSAWAAGCSAPGPAS